MSIFENDFLMREIKDMTKLLGNVFLHRKESKEIEEQDLQDELEAILKQLNEEERYGKVLRAKGMVKSNDDTWLYFDFVPEEYEIRVGAASYTGRFCVIGSQLHEEALAELFKVD